MGFVKKWILVGRVDCYKNPCGFSRNDKRYFAINMTRKWRYAQKWILGKAKS
ncbi:hypothetical protein [Helicobacter zhangjianzhongii]|uniref:Uncharacterized protein n=1 Tax=Helicobacter zhangjianzhongii TaxID=2974574 RepID=A0ACC6FT32_9HELI|nr:MULTISPECIES: hypothetical protein [unclassified Helicobacter]MDL0080234.1 hypothetical protein [Helicobacter sp. CPD2-1]MDL0082295.1 hypothetical protein [Helicobacter sp. XJK30-2]